MKLSKEAETSFLGMEFILGTPVYRSQTWPSSLCWHFPKCLITCVPESENRLQCLHLNLCKYANWYVSSGR